MAVKQLPKFDFERDDPRKLIIEIGAPEVLFRAVDGIAHWTDRALKVADAAITLWASNAHSRKRDIEGLLEVHALIDRLQVIQPVVFQFDEAKVAAYYSRWDGIASMLIQRLSDLVKSNPVDVEKRDHMLALKAVLSKRGRAEVPVETLADALSLSERRVNQLLALAESAGLVDMRKVEGVLLVKCAGLWAAGEDQPIMCR